MKKMEGYTCNPQVISSLNKLKESHERVFEAMRFYGEQITKLLNVWVHVGL